MFENSTCKVLKSYVLLGVPNHAKKIVLMTE